MGVKAAQFLEKVARSSIVAARKKDRLLKWSQGSMYRTYQRTACIMGIAELAKCSKLEDVAAKGHPVDMRRSRLGKSAAKSIMSVTRCPLRGLDDKEKMTCGSHWYDAQHTVSHINDRHATSLRSCKSLLLKVARMERASLRVVA